MCVGINGGAWVGLGIKAGCMVAHRNKSRVHGVCVGIKGGAWVRIIHASWEARTASMVGCKKGCKFSGSHFFLLT